MKRICLLFFIQSLIFNSFSSFGQGGTWTWISGDSALNSLAVFGTQGVPSVNNHPPSMYEPIEWKDKQGNFWIYGGMDFEGFDSLFSDLWKYSPVSNEWTWVKGNGMSRQPAVYGTQGVADPLNTPGDRAFCGITWVDTSGDLWLFGGTNNNSYLENNLWRYNISSNEWTWMKGDTLSVGRAVHGVQGVPSPANTPGGRAETCTAWTDSANNLWLFGGVGLDDSTNGDGYLDDLMKYDIVTNEWTWMKGSSFDVNDTANYGIEGVASESNDPGGRPSYTKWKDNQGNFWIMGGTYFSPAHNDVWKYDLSVNEWTWVNGTNVDNDTGSYQSNCTFNASNLPGARYEHRSSVTDNCGRFWLFGGVTLYDNKGECLNDLWVFDPQQLEWNWLSGTNVPDQPGNYGALGVASPSNAPPSRFGAVAWWGNDNKFYMFGGAVTGGGTHSDVWVFNPDTNCVPSVCNSVTVPPPVANFQSNTAAICANACINFTDLSTNATGWYWKFAGALDSTSAAQNPQSVCYQSPGSYNVTLIASNSGGSDSVTFTNYIVVKSAPPTPSISQTGTTLYCSTDSSYISYQWFADTNLIVGATDTSLVITQGGNYNVQVSDKSGCKIAVGINIILGLQNYSNNNILSLSPNPATDELTANGNWKSENGKKRLTVFNAIGGIIYTEEINSAMTTINCKPFSPGIYFVRVVTENGQWAGKFVKE